MPGDRAKKAKKRVQNTGSGARKQASGTWSNARGVLNEFGIDRIIPSGVADFVQESFDLSARAAGRDSQAAGLFSSTTIMILGVLTSWAYVGIVVFAIGALLFVYNLWRLIPAVNSAHKKAGKRVGLYKDRDIPAWKRD